MKINNISLLYSLGTMVCESVLATIMYLSNMSPFSSDQIMLFLQIFIPSMMVENFIVLRMIAFKKKHDHNNEVILLVFSLACFLIGSIVCHFIAILFGAAVIESIPETFIFSCLCSSLTAFPLYLVHEGRWDEFMNYLSDTINVKKSLADCIKMVSIFTIIGAWLGAFPIPLDWDRDWQAWPITCCVGAIAGHLMGLTYVIFSCVGIIPEMKEDWKNKIT